MKKRLTITIDPIDLLVLVTAQRCARCGHPADEHRGILRTCLHREPGSFEFCPCPTYLDPAPLYAHMHARLA